MDEAFTSAGRYVVSGMLAIALLTGITERAWALTRVTAAIIELLLRRVCDQRK